MFLSLVMDTTLVFRARRIKAVTLWCVP
jgi:hypothetical protein